MTGPGTPVLLHTAESLARNPTRFGNVAYRHQANLGRAVLEQGAATNAPVLALNFHEILSEERADAAEQLDRLSSLGPSFDPDRPADELQVMAAFYDGDRGTGLWAADLCSRFGLRAFFYPLRRTYWEPAPRLTDDDLAEIAEDHELCFHTATHRAASKLAGADLEAEVTEPVERITRAQRRPPRMGAWLGGTRFDSSPANRLLRDLGVTHITSNWSVEATASCLATTGAS
jgi:peptidoglycan/xylan/chitin deacetylase (PgdA/CDA1 family)